jgi:hypothetical protein
VTGTLSPAIRARAVRVRVVHRRLAAGRFAVAVVMAGVAGAALVIGADRGLGLFLPWALAGAAAGILTRLPWAAPVLLGVAVLVGLLVGLWPDLGAMVSVCAGVVAVSVAAQIGRGCVSVAVLRVTRWAVR